MLASTLKVLVERVSKIEKLGAASAAGVKDFAAEDEGDVEEIDDAPSDEDDFY